MTCFPPFSFFCVQLLLIMIDVKQLFCELGELFYEENNEENTV